MSKHEAPDFVLALLTELRVSGYRPGGWARFFGRSWARSRATARRHPRLVASWRHVTLGLALAEAGALALEARLGRAEDARRAAPGAALYLAYAQFDAYAHLGMNNSALGTPLNESLGLANSLTLARQALVGLLLGHLLGGRPASRPVALAALLGACATDVTDGVLARHSGRQTRLGAYLDAEADLACGLGLALTASVRGWMPRWLAALLLIRWLVPFVFASGAYFAAVRRPRLEATRAGKAARVAQALALGATLLPVAGLPGLARMRRVAFAAAAVPLIAAPLAQLRTLRGRRSPRCDARVTSPTVAMRHV